MKLHERINCILLGTLWCLAIVLVLDFWLNTAYHFDMFSGRHWRFVAELQAAHKPIYSGFYISMILAILICIFGLFILLRPKFRKIVLKPTTPQPTKTALPTDNNTDQDNIISRPQQQPEPSQTPQKNTPPEQVPSIERPPHLHIQPTHNTITPTKRNTVPEQKTTPEPRYTHEIREIFETNGYRVLTPKNISGVQLSVVALGTNETLWLGACDTSHEKMADVILSFKNIFQETLEDIEIDINAFIINPTDNESVDAIIDFASLKELTRAIDNNPNEPEKPDDTESGNMDAFAGYIETVLTYLGKK